LIVSTTIVTVITWTQPAARAIVLMGWGLILIWCFAGGLVQYSLRNIARRFVGPFAVPPSVVFILFATGLFCVEEAVATAMTDCAPLLGVKIGQAYITASTNYIRVVLLHSGPVIVPLLFGWTVVLRKWSFSPFAVFLMFGLTGAALESFFQGFAWGKLAEFALWIFVYGNMVWLPVYCLPKDRGATRPTWLSYPLAPILAVLAALPLLAIFGAIVGRFFHPPPLEFPLVGR
jgi:hypothetical protein